MEINTVKFEDKLITSYKDTWKWGNFTSSDIKEISNDKYNQIDKLFKAEIKRIEKLEQKQLEKEQEEFEALVAKANKDGFETEFRKGNQDVSLSKQYQARKISARITFKEDVWSSGSWHSHKTTSPWCVEFDYKTTRYKTFERAFKRATEKIVEHIESLEAKAKATQATNERDETISKELSLIGLELYNERNRRGSNYQIGKILKVENPEQSYSNMVKVSGEVYLHNDKPIEEHEIKSIKLQGKISVENFRQLTVFLDQMVKNEKIKED